MRTGKHEYAIQRDAVNLPETDVMQTTKVKNIDKLHIRVYIYRSKAVFSEKGNAYDQDDGII